MIIEPFPTGKPKPPINPLLLVSFLFLGAILVAKTVLLPGVVRTSRCVTPAQGGTFNAKCKEIQWDRRFIRLLPSCKVMEHKLSELLLFAKVFLEDR